MPDCGRIEKVTNINMDDVKSTNIIYTKENNQKHALSKT